MTKDLSNCLLIHNCMNEDDNFGFKRNVRLPQLGHQGEGFGVELW